jgi:hypothetical protein
MFFIYYYIIPTLAVAPELFVAPIAEDNDIFAYAYFKDVVS